MDLDLSGKNALVCGSSQGLGLASAIELSLLGASVILLARNEKKLEAALQKLDKSKGQSHSLIVADFNYPEQVSAAAEKAVEGSDIHILVNNTGGPTGGPIVSASTEEFSQAFSNHLLCNHILVQKILPGMKRGQWGRVINIISTSVKQPIPGLGVSNTIRAAVANWAKTLATEVAAFGITVNNVLPGFTHTARLKSLIANKAKETGLSEKEVAQQMAAQIPVGRIGHPEDFGAAVAFLCSPAASYITGINLPVDGGRTSCL